MARISYVNGQYLPHHEAAVHVEDRGYQFADGIYEYIAFYNHTLLDGDAHLKRLERSLGELRIPMPVSIRAMHVIIRQLIARNSRIDGGLYIQVTRGVARRDHPFPRNTKPALVMTVCAAKTPKEHEVKDGVKVITAPDIRWGRCDIKSISLLANVLAKQAAGEKHTREAWLVGDDRTVTEGAVSNAYIISKEGELVTHPLDEHVLGGITRDVVLRLARKAGITVAERSFNTVEVKNAREAFITSTSANVLPVIKVDDKLIGNGKPGPITRQLQELYRTYVFKQTGRML
jgi:D-alanine transaminase